MLAKYFFASNAFRSISVTTVRRSSGDIAAKRLRKCTNPLRYKAEGAASLAVCLRDIAFRSLRVNTKADCLLAFQITGSGSV